jgi:hypothetical protein
MRLRCSVWSASSDRATEAPRLSSPSRVSGRLRTGLAILALLCVTGLALVGCGGDSAPTRPWFTTSVVTTRNEVDGVLARITQAQSKEELLQRMDEAAAVIDDAATELDGNGAPEGLEDDTTKLVGALHQLSVDLSAFAHDAGVPGGEALLIGGPGLNFESWDQANAALASLANQGIEVEQIGRH